MTAARPGLTGTCGKVASPGLPGATHDEWSAKCSRCGSEHERDDQRYCRDCHAAYMREWRKTHFLNEDHRRRRNSRSTAQLYRKRGKLVPLPCACCAAPTAEMHHIDHERPLEVTWLCRACHLSWHAFWRETILEVFEVWLGGIQVDVSRETSSDRAISSQEAAA